MKNAIEIHQLGKLYQRGGKPSETFVSSLFSKSKTNDFWAIKDIDLTVKQGEVLGLLGANGAGKSTLLKVLSRVTHPTKGWFETFGKVGSLLEVGTGFHPDLTGRENIFLNGTLLGMKSAEVAKYLDEIIDFSGVEAFLDTPIKHYSSGMKVRLAFSVAAHLRTEILLIDEVLAVGDAEFQKKCLSRMNLISSEEGRTIVFVSHNLAAVKSLCSQVALIDKGQLINRGETHQMVDQYLNNLKVKGETISLENRTDRGGEGQARVTHLSWVRKSENTELMTGEDSQLEVHIRSNQHTLGGNAELRINIMSEAGQFLAPLSNSIEGTSLVLKNEDNKFYCDVSKLPLMDGNYYLDLRLLVDGRLQDQISSAQYFSVLEGDFFGTGKIYVKGRAGIHIPQKWKI